MQTRTCALHLACFKVKRSRRIHVRLRDDALNFKICSNDNTPPIPSMVFLNKIDTKGYDVSS